MISDNYGNRLQNYALQEALTEIGHDVETLNNPWEEDYNPYRERLISNLKKITYYITKRPKRYIRKIRFEKFNNRYIEFSKFWLNNKKDKKKAAQFYDIFVCGSDQVWNSEAKEITGKYFADFAAPSKRASYAASFGIDRIIPERKEEFAQYLSGMKYISVREQNGIDIIHDIFNKKVYCHVDPTFLLSADKWDKLLSSIGRPNKNYIFCYFLGKPSNEIYNKIKKYGTEKNLKICLICNELESPFNTAGPENFISFIKNAEFVLTDSFHGTVFSIIYEKPFYVFMRSGASKGMLSRIHSVLNLFNLQYRFEPTELNEQNIYNIDFSMCRKILNQERKKAFDYLRNITNN